MNPDDSYPVEPIQQTRLENGLIVLSEHLPSIKSVLLGLWVKSGSRSEEQSFFGMSHFLEHMLFKGTAKRNSREIAQSLESVGGELNAFTSREHCCYYAKAVDEYAELIFDVISDLVFAPTFPTVDLEKEKQVICQEIDMYDDSPEELVHEQLVQTMYGESLGHPVIGYKPTIRGFTQDDLQTFHQEVYYPENLFLTIVGNLQSIQLESMLNQYFNVSSNTGKDPVKFDKEQRNSGFKAVQKDLEQLHISMGWHAYGIAHEDRYVLHIISTHLGGGMSSVLFQEIRENLGLAYSIYSFVRAYHETGILGIYCASKDQEIVTLLEHIHKSIKELTSAGLDLERLDRLKAQLKGNLLLGLERSSFRMNRMGIGHMYFDSITTPDQLIALVNKVTPEDILRVSKEVFSRKGSCITVGNLSQDALKEAIDSTGMFS